MPRTGTRRCRWILRTVWRWVVDNPQDGIAAGNVTAYINGQIAINSVNFCSCCILTVSNINWNNSWPTLFTAPTNVAATNAALYVSGIQFHATALTPQMLAGIGSPVTGPAPMNETSVGAPPKALGGIVQWRYRHHLVRQCLRVAGNHRPEQRRVDRLHATLHSKPNGRQREHYRHGQSVDSGPEAKFYRLVFRP